MNKKQIFLLDFKRVGAKKHNQNMFFFVVKKPELWWIEFPSSV